MAKAVPMCRGHDDEHSRIIPALRRANRTMRLTAKAAVAVYEAAVEERQS